MDFRTTRTLDSSTLSDYLKCPRRYWFRHVEGLTPDETKIALGNGTAFHAGLELAYRWLRDNPGQAWPEHIPLEAVDEAVSVYYENIPEQDINMEPLRTPGKLGSVLLDYFTRYPREPFRVLEVEKPFSLNVTATGYGGLTSPFEPLPEGVLFRWIGRMDLVTEWPHGIIVVDHKTTTQLGPTYAEQWNPDLQMTGYITAARLEYGEDRVFGAMVNAVQFAKTKSDMARIHTSRNEDQLSAHHKVLTTWAERIDDDRTFPQNTAACHLFGGCPYVTLCRRYPGAVDDVSARHRSDPDYKVEVWNPLDRLGV